jgi:excisionase family DNA binding protein
MTDLARALLDALDEEDLAALARRLGPFLPATLTPAPDRWLTAHEAADYLGIAYSTLKKRMAAGELPCEREGGRCYFRRADLDAWRLGARR